MLKRVCGSLIKQRALMGNYQFKVVIFFSSYSFYHIYYSLEILNYILLFSSFFSS